MKRFLWMWVVLLGVGFAPLAQGEESQKTAFPPLVAHYELTEMEKEDRRELRKYSWYLLRSPGKLEIRDGKSTVGELWERQPDGQIYFTKLFHNHKRAIDYYYGDLMALKQKVDWGKINRMVDSNILKQAPVSGKKTKVKGAPAIILKTEKDGVKTEILWLPEKQIPARMIQHFPKRTVAIDLLETWPLEEAPVSHSKKGDYKHTDFSDIGDLEADPFFRQLAHQNTAHDLPRH